MTSFVSNLKTNLIVHTLFYSILGIVGAQAQEMNGFDLSKATIPIKEIHSGGPGRDGIPSIDAPKFIAAAKVNFLKDDDSVVSLSRGGKSRAYPLRILVWHEIVNDKFGGDEIAVTYCPLCGTAMVFDRKIAGKVRTFGVSGLLYQSDVLMFDRENESLWSQLKMQAVSGGDAGSDLTWLPSEQMSWKAWRAKNPDGEVLSTATGHRRNYKAQAYADYFENDRIMFPVPQHRTELPNKERVIGIIVEGVAKAYPISVLTKTKAEIADEVGGKRIRPKWDSASQSQSVEHEDGTPIPSVQVFWFAWQGFNPKTELHAVPKSE